MVAGPGRWRVRVVPVGAGSRGRRQVVGGGGTRTVAGARGPGGSGQPGEAAGSGWWRDPDGGGCVRPAEGDTRRVVGEKEVEAASGGGDGFSFGRFR